MTNKLFLRVCVALTLTITTAFTIFPQFAYSAVNESDAKYEKLQRLVNGESGIYKEFYTDLKGNVGKIKSTGEYYRGSEIYKYSDGTSPNLYLLFSDQDGLNFSGVAATKGNFFGINVGKDSAKDITAVLGNPTVFEQAGDIVAPPLYIYDRPGGRLFIICNEDNIIVDVYMRFSYSPKYDCYGRIDNDGLTNDYNYSFGIGTKRSFKGEILLMSHGRFLPQYDILLYNGQASCSLAAVEAVTGAIAVEENDVVTLTKGNATLTIDSKKAIFNAGGNIKEMDIRPSFRTGQTLYLPLRAVAEAFGKKVGYLPATWEYKTANFSDYPISQVGIAYNPVVWVDDYEYMDNNAKTNDEALNWLKDFMTAELDKLKKVDSYNSEPFSFDESTLLLIEKNIVNTKYIGQVGRYAYFIGPYATLVDFYSDTVYFYNYGHSYGVMSNATARSSAGLPLFISMYFAD